MSKIVELANSYFTDEDIAQVLVEVDHMFTPNLNIRILKKTGLQSFGEYVNKVISNGSILISYDEQEIEGICMMYHNDLINFTAYISVLAVKKKFQKKGIGQKLLEVSSKLAINSQMKKIALKTWRTNHDVIQFYCRSGFVKTKQDESDLTLEKQL